jgi:hypothetical protein
MMNYDRSGNTQDRRQGQQPAETSTPPKDTNTKTPSSNDARKIIPVSGDHAPHPTMQ